MPSLVLLQGPQKGTVFPLLLPITLVGRIDSSHLVIEEASVSRIHARFLLGQDDSVVVEDLESRAGTLVNGKRVIRSKLFDGDEIALGNVVLVFQR